ncbi:MAG: transporter [Desulfobacterales bacterium]|jgi:hypothetical protein|nr:transporter [Desulfobacterales bacterium]
MTRFIVGWLVLLCSVLAQNNFASADNHARDYLPAPPGCLGVLLYYNHSWADTLYGDGNNVADNLDFSGDVGTARFVYFYMLGSFEFYSNLIIPFGHLAFELPGEQDFSASGLADPILQSGVWFYQNNQSKTWAGVTTYVFPPLGNYDNKGVLSLGANQWRFREELNLTQGFSVLPGHNAYFELTIAGDFFTDNDDFGPASQNRSKDPILTVESHLSYDVTRTLFASTDYYYHHGGKTNIEGIDQQDNLSNHTLGASLAYNLTPRFQVLLQYLNDVEVESGPKSQAIMTRFLYICDLSYLFRRP